MATLKCSLDTEWLPTWDICENKIPRTRRLSYNRIVSAVPHPPKWTLDMYLEFEAKSEVRHEFMEGQAYAMSGGTRAHARLAAQIIGELALHLRHLPCDVYGSDMKVLVESENAAFYPDVSVTCSESRNDTAVTISDPILIMEVLSPATERFDRTRKFDLYRKIASLQEYVLVSTETRRVEIFRRVGEDWISFPGVEEGDFELSSLRHKISLDAIYGPRETDEETV